MNVKILIGNCRDVLRRLPDASVQCCVTSPPYFGLRDYGVAGQIGLEPTPDAFVAEMVAVFREVRRVLRDDGTLWLNLGDSYSTGPSGKTREDPFKASGLSGGLNNNRAARSASQMRPKSLSGLKPKDLIGIPWRVAFALQQPFYAGTIKNEMDRVWLAAMLDGEGCFYIHRRQAGQHAGEGYYRQTDNYSCAFEVANTSEAIVQRCLDLTGVGSIIRQDKDRRQPLFRWTVRSNEAKALIREIYPYLVAKKQQARIVFGITSSGKDAESGWAAMKILHSGGLTDVDYSAPPSCHEPGWYLRSSIIWAKPNPMPESVRDRPTSAHENIFLLAKSERYWFDADAVKEAAMSDGSRRDAGGTDGYVDLGMRKGRAGNSEDGLRNIRNVWTVPSQPFSDAHFATFPPALIEPCVKAGCPAGGTVLDPFGGAGTTGLVADRLQRHAVLIELNPDYAAMAERRIAREGGLFADVGVSQRGAVA